MRITKLLPLLLLIASLGCSQSSPTEPVSTDPDVHKSLIAEETAKWDLTFGSSDDRQRALRMYAEDFTSIGYGPTGASRVGKAEVAQGISFFPTFPKGTFSISDMKVIASGDESVILSYRISGPGPKGPGWSAYASSVWTRENGEWKTAFYQATEL